MTRRDLHGWFIVAVLIIVMICVWGSVAAAVTAFFPSLVKEFGWSRAQVSSLASVVEIGFCIGCPVAGWMLDKIGARPPMIIGAVLAGVALFVASRSHSFELTAASYFAAGLGRGLVTTVPAAVIVGHWFSRNRGFAMGLTMVGASAGGMIMVDVAAYVESIAGWRQALDALGAPILVVVIPLVILFVRMKPPEPVAASALDKARVEDSLQGLTLAESLRTNSFWMLMAVGILWFFGIGAILTQAMIYLMGIGYSRETAAFAVSILFGSTALGKPVFGLLADWIGPRRAQFVAFLMMAAGAMLLLYSAIGAILVVFLCVYGLAWGASLALLPLITIESLGLKHYGSIGGTLSALNVVGSAGGPLVVGYLFDLTGNYVMGFELCLVLFLIAGVLALRCKPEMPGVPSKAPLAAAIRT